MPRGKRLNIGGIVYHALNRGNGLREIFAQDGDYQAFLKVLNEACERFDMRLLGYCLMPNHWHLTLFPKEDGDLSKFMGWLTLTHTQRFHAAHASAGTGHVYQGRFKSFPVQTDEHYLTLCRYVERNALKAGMVERAELWRWGSLWQRMNQDTSVPLSDWPVERPADWLTTVNHSQSDAEIANIEKCIERGRPFGSERWQAQTAKRLGLEHTLRNRGRPPKAKAKTA
jgi:putative transposase